MKINNMMPNISPLQPNGTQESKTQRQNGVSEKFQTIFDTKLNECGLKFSSHALDRIQSREIPLSSETLQKINHAVEQAAKKGARESLILSDQMAMIVSVKNKTVITAMNLENMKENIFTNIDSAVMI